MWHFYLYSIQEKRADGAGIGNDREGFDRP